VEVCPLSREVLTSMHFITKCRLLFPHSSAGTSISFLCSWRTIRW